MNIISVALLNTIVALLVLSTPAIALVPVVPMEVFEWATEKCVDKGGVQTIRFNEIKYNYYIKCKNVEQLFAYIK
jgi:hypothetical protein